MKHFLGAVRPRTRRGIGAVVGLGAVALCLAGTALVSAGGPIRPNVAPTADEAEVFVGQTPARALDTRQAGGAPFGVNETRVLDLSGLVPPEATTAVLNITLDRSTDRASSRCGPQPRPNSSANNTQPGEIMPNEFIAKLGTNQSVQVFNERNSTDIVIDVVGYYVPLSEVIGVASGPVASTSGPSGTQPATILTTTGPETIATFTAPADGSYVLTASVGVTFVNTITTPATPLGAGAIATVNCTWDDGNGITRGTSVTSDVTIGLVTIPGIDTGNITLLGSVEEVQGGDTVDLVCNREQAVSVNDDVSVDPAFTALQVAGV